MYNMILNSSSLLHPRDVKPDEAIVVREASHEDLKLLFSTEEIFRQLFPAGRLLNCYMPYRPIDANIRHIRCKRGGAFFSLEDPETLTTQGSTNHILTDSDLNGNSTNNEPPKPSLRTLNQHQNIDPVSVQNIAMVTCYYCFPTPDGFLYYLDPYARKGLSPAHFQAHFKRNMETLGHYFPNLNGKLTVTHDSNVPSDHIISCLKDHGIVDEIPGQEKTQILYERDRALCGFPVEE